MIAMPLELTRIVGDSREACRHNTHTVFGAISQVIPLPEPTAEQRMKLIEASGSLDFWDRDEEDIYTLEDGDPV